MRDGDGRGRDLVREVERGLAVVLVAANLELLAIALETRRDAGSIKV
jgi:hypothetical protein